MRHGATAGSHSRVSERGRETALKSIGTTCLLAWPLLGGVASATEISVNFASPVFALGNDGSDSLRYARYETGGVTTELTTQGGGSFGYWNAGDLKLGPDDDVTPYIGSVDDCGNHDACRPYVATFSVLLDGAAVRFFGVGNFSGSDADMLSASYFLEAWSGPNGTGTLLGRVTDPGGIIPSFVPGQTFYELPASLSISAAGIRSIVFAADVLTDSNDFDGPVNLASGVGLTITIVPEPTSGALLALGLVALAARRRSFVGA
jgi:hypothetical protein